jgi:hypothetical protein
MRRALTIAAALGCATSVARVDTLARESARAAAQTAFAAYRNSMGADLPKVAAAERRSTYQAAVLTGYVQELRRVAAAASK